MLHCSGYPSSAKVLSIAAKRHAQIRLIRVFAHVSDADDLARQNIEDPEIITLYLSFIVERIALSVKPSGTSMTVTVLE